MQKKLFYTFIIFFRLLVLLAFSVDSIFALEDSIEDGLVPSDRNSSVQYQLYTPKNPMKPCYLEPEVSVFDKCAFNSSYETKFLIHGFLSKLVPGNVFEKVKGTLLQYNNYNVVIVNWSKYNQVTYPHVYANAYFVGTDVAVLINFITAHTGVKAESIHIIGHSLGAQLSGVAGKRIKNLGRITGLDPAGPGYSVDVTFNRLTATDAKFVDVIHTSNSGDVTGYGMEYPMGLINFYPNGGELQTMCAIGKNYSDSNGAQLKIHSAVDQASCSHDSAILYFLHSISDCKYLSTQCSSYSSYNKGQCKSPLFKNNMMGFHCSALPGINIHSTFYLNTSATSPFC